MNEGKCCIMDVMHVQRKICTYNAKVASTTHKLHLFFLYLKDCYCTCFTYLRKDVLHHLKMTYVHIYFLLVILLIKGNAYLYYLVHTIIFIFIELNCTYLNFSNYYIFLWEDWNLQKKKRFLSCKNIVVN